jgi:hypothetical protein
MNEDEIILTGNIHVPKTCEKCGRAAPKYMGVGEYKCENCGFLMYDDFGLVRNYLDEHKGATQSQVSKATGVAMETIRQFLREERLEIVAGSGVFLSCEICNAPIRSGRYCEACAAKVDRLRDAAKAAEHRSNKSNIQGYATGTKGESGKRRFKR